MFDSRGSGRLRRVEVTLGGGGWRSQAELPVRNMAIPRKPSDHLRPYDLPCGLLPSYSHPLLPFRHDRPAPKFAGQQISILFGDGARHAVAVCKHIAPLACRRAPIWHDQTGGPVEQADPLHRDTQDGCHLRCEHIVPGRDAMARTSDARRVSCQCSAHNWLY